MSDRDEEEVTASPIGDFEYPSLTYVQSKCATCGGGHPSDECGQLCPRCKERFVVGQQLRTYIKEMPEGGVILGISHVRCMSKDAFEQGYAYRSVLTVEELHSLGQYAQECDCEEPECSGWQMVTVRSI